MARARMLAAIDRVNGKRDVSCVLRSDMGSAERFTLHVMAGSKRGYRLPHSIKASAKTREGTPDAVAYLPDAMPVAAEPEAADLAA
jgi:hypothetical protein